MRKYLKYIPYYLVIFFFYWPLYELLLLLISDSCPTWYGLWFRYQIHAPAGKKQKTFTKSLKILSIML